jgi:hypothetical protein
MVGADFRVANRDLLRSGVCRCALPDRRYCRWFYRLLDWHRNVIFVHEADRFN